MFIIFFLFGLFLSLFNMDLFTAFLWLTECVIVFISILFLFYLNVYGNVNKINLIIYSYKYFGVYLGFIFLINQFVFNYTLENFFINEFFTVLN